MLYFKKLRPFVLASLFLLLVLGFQNFSVVGEKVQLEGELEVLHVHNVDKSSHYEYFLRDKSGKKTRIKFKGKAPSISSGSKIRVNGDLSDSVLALDSGTGGVQILALANPNTFGEQKTVVLLVNFLDNQTQPYTISQASTVVFGSSNDFFKENSFGQTWLSGQVYGWLTLPIAQTCSPDNIAAYANQAATAAGINLSLYTRRIFVFPRLSACTWTGLGTVGGNPSSTWVNGMLYRGVVSHEVGHNLGLWHSHSLECGATTLSSTCSRSEYGDAFDTMGNGGIHFNAFQKERLGWLNYGTSPAIATVESGSSSFTLKPYSANDGGLKAVKVLKGIDSATGQKKWYYVEFRQPLGFDSDISRFPWAVNGVLIRMGRDGDGDSSDLLDLTPNSSSTDDISDSPLALGKTYSDSESGVSISLLSVSSTGATVSVSAGGSSSPTCVRAQPLVTVTPSTSASVAPGTAVSYSVSIKNNDNQYCAASTFNLSKSVPSGWSSSLSTSSVSLSPGASGASTLTVTSPTTALAGSYSVSASAVNSSATSYSGSASAVYSVASVATCTRANPLVTLSASTSASVAPGTSITYTMSVKNNDSSACSASTFNLSRAVPSGWGSSLSTSFLSLSPGASSSATLTVTSASTALAGSYSLSASAVNSSATSYSGSASASYSVASVAVLSATVSTSKASYLKGDSVDTTASVSSGGSAVSGATVTFTITKSDGGVVTASAVTDASGKAMYKMRLSRKAAVGIYQVKINVNSAGKTAIASTSFTVN